MGKNNGVTGYLEKGDIIKVINPLLKDEYSKYPVKKIDGNKAITDFRDFNKKIYNEKYVYEYGKRLSPIYNNTYLVIKSKP